MEIYQHLNKFLIVYKNMVKDARAKFFSNLVLNSQSYPILLFNTIRNMVCSTCHSHFFQLMSATDSPPLLSEWSMTYNIILSFSSVISCPSLQIIIERFFSHHTLKELTNIVSSMKTSCHPLDHIHNSWVKFSLFLLNHIRSLLFIAHRPNPNLGPTLPQNWWFLN